MSRTFQVFGEFIIEVSGGQIHRSQKQQLGLSTDPVVIIPRYIHRDKVTDDFGPEIPVEVQWMMAEAFIQISLVHYDSSILDKCMRAAMGGGELDVGTSAVIAIDGFMGPAGRPLGNGAALNSEGNQYTTVYLTPFNGAPILPYRFRACYLNSQPLEIPVGTTRTIVKCNWRCIPYRPLTTEEVKSTSGVALWDRSSEFLS